MVKRLITWWLDRRKVSHEEEVVKYAKALVKSMESLGYKRPIDDTYCNCINIWDYGCEYRLEERKSLIDKRFE